MEFLDKLVIPYTGGHPGLNYLLLAIASIILVSYSGILFSSVALSLFYSAKRYLGDTKAALMAKEYADMGTRSIMAPFGMGVLPFLSIIILYTQALHGSGSPVSAYLLFGFIIYVAALGLIMAYKHSLHISAIFKYVENENDSLKVKLAANEEYMRYSASSSLVRAKSGFWGWALLILSLILLLGSQSFSLMGDKWDAPAGMFSMFAIANFWAGFFSFIFGSFALVSGFYLYKLYRDFRDKEIDETGYHDKARTVNAWISIISTSGLLLSMSVSYMTTPRSALTPALFGLILFGLIFAFIFINLAYLVLRDREIRYGKFALTAVVLVFAASALKDNIAFSASNKKNAAENYYVYEQKKAELLAASGVSQKIDGKAIYDAKCTACHAFDRKLVGPAHKDVLPKYAGKEQALVDFILNPTKVDPAFPPMPQQGLKPNEAKAVAEYMLKEMAK